MSPHNTDFHPLIVNKIKELRAQLLDLSRRNPLISTNLNYRRTNALLRLIDVSPQQLANQLNAEKWIEIQSLPPLEETPLDEKTLQFKVSVSEARATDSQYLEEMSAIEELQEPSPGQAERVERSLKDRVRAALGMAPRATRDRPKLEQHARNNGISPEYELARGAQNDESTPGRLQTLLLPQELERKLNGLNSKYRTWIQETGINVLHAAVGFLEWEDPTNQKSSWSPILLWPLELRKTKTPEGSKFEIRPGDEGCARNSVLAEMFKRQHSVELPEYEGGCPEQYFRLLERKAPKTMNWRVSRQAVVGVFPSARMAMFHDLDPDQAQITQHPLIETMLVGRDNDGDTPYADEYEVDEPKVEAKVPYLVKEADASQFSALVDVADGKNVALEGPPGTGKSQTIVNVIAGAIAQGKKVLFVAEKLAALEVVRNRMAEIGLGEFVLPLLAQSSSKAQVYASLDDRLNARSARPVKEYEARYETYKQSRDELAEYIQIISSEFRKSGYTVREILGLSTALSNQLANVPRAAWGQAIPNLERLDRRRIEKILEIVEALSNELTESEQRRQFWTGLKLPHIDGVQADNIQELASDVADAANRLDINLEALRANGIDSSVDISELEATRAALQELESASDFNSLILEILEKSAVDHCARVIDKSQELQALEGKVGADVDLTAEDYEEKLRKAAQLVCPIKSRHESLEALRHYANKLDEDRALLAELQIDCKRIVDAYPALKGVDLEAVGAASEILAATPSKALLARTEASVTAAGIASVKILLHSVKDLSNKMEALAASIDTSTSLPSSQLDEMSGILRKAGVFRLFSPEYRHAKSVYKSISKTRHYDKFKAAYNLSKLVSLNQSIQALKSDFAHLNLSPDVFRGLETDVDALEWLVEFVERLDEALPGSSNFEMRQFLRTAPVEALVIIPSVPPMHLVPESTILSGIQRLLSELDDKKQESRELISELEKCLACYADPEVLRFSELEELHSQARKLNQCRATLDDLTDYKDMLDRSGVTVESGSNGAERLRNVLEVLMGLDPIVQQTCATILSSKLWGESPISIEPALRASAEFHDSLQRLAEDSGIDFNAQCGSSPYSELAQFFAECAEDRAGLFLHAKICGHLRALESFGVSELVEKVAAESTSFNELPETIEALLIRHLARSVFEAYGGRLSKFDGKTLGSLREKLADSDRALVSLSREVVRGRALQASTPIRGNSRGNKSAWTEMSLIRNEINKKRSHVPLRDLARRARRSLFELKPCWMMSPLAVAQYLPVDGPTFDLCVIDEASQMPPADALGALARSEQVLIVGDRHQLPPTNFFRKMLDPEDEDSDEVLAEESILDMGNAVLHPIRQLRWHYRSRHSALIAFSNRYVYGDRLQVLPSAMEDVSDSGVQLEFIDGIYQAGVNPIEAKAVIRSAARLMKECPDRSLGIVTMNQKQRDLLEEELQYLIDDDRGVSDYVSRWQQLYGGLQSLFVKNLENVQGDERDVMFISTVYGPEQPGARVNQRFGPISGPSGRRRLNVLFTRARHQIVTFTSMKPTDITATESSNQGAYLLKKWLEYSKTGRLEAGIETNNEPDSDFEEFVAKQIEAMGCEAIHQVGVTGYFIDIGVRHPAYPYGFIMGVECDGASYHSSRSARDRDRLRQEVLEGLGWRLYRIWSTDWFNDTRTEIERLREAIQRRLSELGIGAVQKNRGTAFEQVQELDFPTPPTEAQSNDSVKPDAVTDLNQPSDGMAGERISVGDTVTVKFSHDPGRPRTYTLSSRINDPLGGVLSIDRPLGAALLGNAAGDTVEYHVDNAVHTAEVLDVEHPE